MERMDMLVPTPLREQVEEYQESEGYDNRSQAARSLIRKGLDSEGA